jgi:hypothetical protein
LAPKGASRFKTPNIRCDKHNDTQHKGLRVYL